MSNIINIDGKNFKTKVEKLQGWMVMTFYQNGTDNCNDTIAAMDNVSAAMDPFYVDNKKIVFGKFYVTDPNSKDEKIISKLNVGVLPCIIIFYNGKEKARVVGVKNEKEIKQLIKENMKEEKLSEIDYHTY